MAHSPRAALLALGAALVLDAGGAAAQQPAAPPRAFVEEAIGARFVLVPGGSFTMGSEYAQTHTPEAERQFFVDESPPHRVALGPYWVGDSEVTNAQFRRFVEETGFRTDAEIRGESLGEYSESTDAAGRKVGQWASGRGLSWRAPGWDAGESHPVAHVSWNDATAFVQWLRDKTGRPYRLLTEAEWEYAAGMGRTLYAWGDGPPESRAGGNIADASFARRYPNWKYPVLAEYDDGYVHTAPVRLYAPNALGLYDMTGNVWEWTADVYSPTYYRSSPESDPTGPPSGAERVHRGGGFDWELPYLRTTKRRRARPEHSAAHIGFRLALDAGSAR